MSQTKYMELDSNYRDRTLYPNPGAFEVNISQTGIKNNLNASDPVTNAYPEVVFRISDFSASSVTLTMESGTLSFSSDATNFVVSSSSAIAVNNYYVGATITVASTPPQQYRITGWTVLYSTSNTYHFRVTIDGLLPSQTPATMTISNPTYTADPLNQYVFIPQSVSIDNYYTKDLIWDQTTNVGVPIVSYDGTTHLAKLSSTASISPTDILVVRDESPSYTGTLAAVGAGYVANTVHVQQTLGPAFVNGFIRLFAVGNPVSAIAPSSNPTTNPNANIILKIIGFNSTTSNGVVTNLYNYPIVETNQYATTPTITTPIFTTPTNYNYEILQFTTDNVSPFVFSGSTTSQTQSVGQELTLNSLTLPNIPLTNGGRIAFYPFVYVELENVSTSGRSNNNILYSNNPNTYRVMFKVPITDLNHPKNAPFVKLTGNGMTQTVTFKQNDNVRVSVKLPNGELFESVQLDNLYGQAPNPFVQISFCFGMKRI